MTEDEKFKKHLEEAHEIVESWPVWKQEALSLALSRKRTVASKRGVTSEEKLERIRKEVTDWASKQGQDRCWYYPDIFRRIASILDVALPEGELPPREEFELGCRKYQDEEYGVG